MKIQIYLAISLLLVPTITLAQQANVNLDYNPQKNTENLIPFSAPLNSPDVRDDGTVDATLLGPRGRSGSGHSHAADDHSDDGRATETGPRSTA